MRKFRKRTRQISTNSSNKLTESFIVSYSVSKTVTFSCLCHGRIFTLTVVLYKSQAIIVFAKWSGTWLPRGSYGVYEVITGSVWLLRDLRGSCGLYVTVTGSTWQLRALCDCYAVYVALTERFLLVWLLRGLRGSCGLYVDVTGSTWQLRALCDCYGVYVAITGSKWLLRGIYVALTERLPHKPSNSHVHPVTATSHSILWRSSDAALTGRLYVKVWPRPPAASQGREFTADK